MPRLLRCSASTVLFLPKHEPLALRTEGAHHVYLQATQRFVVVDDSRYPGEFKTSTRQYIYWLSESADGDPLISWHWHPEAEAGKREPHAHVAAEGFTPWGKAGRKLHIPTERTPFELVVLFAIEDLGVLPARDDWREVLDESVRAFRRFRRWPTEESGLDSQPPNPAAEPQSRSRGRKEASRPPRRGKR